MHTDAWFAHTSTWLLWACATAVPGSQHRHRVVAPTGCGFPPLPGSLVRSPTPHYCSSYALWTCHRVRVVRLALQGAGLHFPYGLGQAGDRGEPFFFEFVFRQHCRGELQVSPRTPRLLASIISQGCCASSAMACRSPTLPFSPLDCAVQAPTSLSLRAPRLGLPGRERCRGLAVLGDPVPLRRSTGASS